MSNDKPVIFFEDGIPMTTSLEVARIFEKAHKHVMEVIRSIDEIIGQNASGATVNKSRCHITEEGFMFIGMKLGGKNADLHRAKVVNLVKILKTEITRLRLEGPAPQVRQQIQSDDWTRQCVHCRQYLPEKAFNVDNSRVPAPQPQIETALQQDERPELKPHYKCAHCKEWLPSKAFNRDYSMYPPLQSWCRQCHKDLAGEMKLIELIPETQVIKVPAGTRPAAPESAATAPVPKPAPRIEPASLIFVSTKFIREMLWLAGRSAPGTASS